MSRKRERGLGATARGSLLKRPAGGEATDERPQQARPASSSIVPALQQGPSDSDGRARELELGLVAPHPQNRAADDLDGLARSIASVGVLQPIVVVPVEIFRANWSGAADDVPTSVEWVVYAGHRRYAASRQAEKSTIPAIIREDLNEPAAAPTTRLVENLHRKDLTPLEEARDFALLADLGHGQTEIAKMCGFSQAHVSKRIRLLGLPQQIQEAVSSGNITLGEADKLTQLADADEQLHVFDRAQRTGAAISSLVSEVEAARRDRERVEAARKQATDAGVEIVDARARFGAGASSHRLNDETAIEAARAAGTLVAEPTPYGVWYYTTEGSERGTASTAAPSEPKLAAVKPKAAPVVDAPPSSDTSAVRSAAAGEFVRKTRPKRKTSVVDPLTLALLHNAHRADVGKARLLAYEWLAETIGDPAGGADVDSWLESLDELDAAWAAYGACVALDELLTRDDPASSVARTHVRRLVTEVGYEPTSTEAAHITEPSEYSGGISEGSNV